MYIKGGATKADSLKTKQTIKQTLKHTVKQTVRTHGKATSQRLASGKSVAAKRVPKLRSKIVNTERKRGAVRKGGFGDKSEMLQKDTGGLLKTLKAKPIARAPHMKRHVKAKVDSNVKRLGLNRLRGGTVKKATKCPKRHAIAVRMNKAALQRMAANARTYATMLCNEMNGRKPMKPERPAKHRYDWPSYDESAHPPIIKAAVQVLKFTPPPQLYVEPELRAEVVPPVAVESEQPIPEKPKRKPFPKMKHTLMSKARYAQAMARSQSFAAGKSAKCLLPMSTSYKDFIRPECRLLEQYKRALATSKHPERLIPQKDSPLYKLLESFEGSLERRQERINEINRTLPANLKIIDYTKNFF